jgi:hypothetical protein
VAVSRGVRQPVQESLDNGLKSGALGLIPTTVIPPATVAVMGLRRQDDCQDGEPHGLAGGSAGVLIVTPAPARRPALAVGVASPSTAICDRNRQALVAVHLAEPGLAGVGEHAPASAPAPRVGA